MDEKEFKDTLSRVRDLYLKRDCVERVWRFRRGLNDKERSAFRAACLGVYGDADVFLNQSADDLLPACYDTVLGEILSGEDGKVSFSRVTRTFRYLNSWPVYLWWVFCFLFLLFFVGGGLLTYMNQPDDEYYVSLVNIMAFAAPVLALSWYIHVRIIRKRTMSAIALSILYDELPLYMESLDFFMNASRIYLNDRWLSKKSRISLKRFIVSSFWFREGQKIHS